MGIANQGVFGGWRKRVGNVVGRIRQGQNVYSIYQPVVANPKTQAQMSHRTGFSLLSRVFSTMLSFIKVSFAKLDGYERGSAFSAAVGYNLKRNAISGVYPSQEVDFENLVVSEGSIDLPYNPNADLDSGTLTATYADNTGRGNAEATDEVMLLLYSEPRNEVAFSTNAALRSARTASIDVPSAWTASGKIHAYLAMRRPSTGVCSVSYYLGNYTA